jgi:chemotaxis protein MotB
MSRRKKHSEHPNHERWLVSYADFITLMFAFFVVMFASSQTDKGKQQQVAESVKRALDDGQIAAAIAGILGGTVDNKGKGNAMLRGPGGTQRGHEQRLATLAELLPAVKFLNAQLRDEVRKGKLEILITNRGLVVSLRQAAFFPSGDDRVNPLAYASIGKIAEVIRSFPNPIRLEGHTDSVPISNPRFRSNWELSAARAIAMMDLLTTKFQIDRSKVAIAGYAETIPVSTNDTEKGRALNRRVDVVLLAQSGIVQEPSGKPSPAGPPAGH